MSDLALEAIETPLELNRRRHFLADGASGRSGIFERTEEILHTAIG